MIKKKKNHTQTAFYFAFSQSLWHHGESIALLVGQCCCAWGCLEEQKGTVQNVIFCLFVCF